MKGLGECSTAFQYYSCCQTKYTETVEGLLKHDVCELKETIRNLTTSCNVSCDTQQVIHATHSDASVFPLPTRPVGCG